MNVINSYLSTYGLWSAERVWIMGYGRVWSDLAGYRLGGREKVWLIGGYGLSQVVWLLPSVVRKRSADKARAVAFPANPTRSPEH